MADADDAKKQEDSKADTKKQEDSKAESSDKRPQVVFCSG